MLGVALNVDFLLHNLPDFSRPQHSNMDLDVELESHLANEITTERAFG
jgi:hypothetical protein